MIKNIFFNNFKNEIKKNQTFFISGGTGSFGKKCTEFILKNLFPKKIIIYSRDEHKQEAMLHELSNFSGKLRFFIGDVRDYPRLNFAMEQVDYVIHAAALKHVHIAEYNPFEVIKTNVIGAENIIRSCLNHKVKKVIALSTDKAVAPINLYGASKLTSDKLFLGANNIKGSRDIMFSVVRYGNVFGSNGSVVPIFLKQKKTGILNVTSKEMTRFNITLDEGVQFVMFSICKMQGGEVFVPKLPSYRLIELAKAFGSNLKIKITGIRPGEKIHEEMITESDSINTIEFKDFFIVLSNDQFDKKKIQNIYCRDIGKRINTPRSYNSFLNTDYLSAQDLKELIKDFYKE